jgi:hypothetical protein
MLGAGQFDVLVVDTFPRGLAGELAGLLPDIVAPKVLVHRDLNPRYVAWAELRSFVTHYDAILVPGETAPLEDLPAAICTEPWLVCDGDELLTSPAARQMLNVDPGDTRPLAVVIGCGKTDESRDAAQLARRLVDRIGETALVRFACLRRGIGCDLADLQVRCWPLMSAMRGADLLIGSGGYNTVHEARATATSLIAVARRRLYDRQFHRLRREERAASQTELIERAAGRINGQTAHVQRPAVCYRNGTHEAVQIIESIVPRY